MNKALLILVFAIFIMPTNVFAENWQLVPSLGAEPIYYDFDNVEKSGATPHILKVTVKRYLSIDESLYYALEGQKPDAIVVTMYINVIERYFEPLDMSLVQDDSERRFIGKIQAEEIFNNVQISLVEPDVKIVLLEGNDAWGIEKLISEINILY